jgi:hypothetical protein
MADALTLVKTLISDNWDPEQYSEQQANLFSDVSSGTTTCTPSDDGSTYTEGSYSVKLAIAEDGSNPGEAKCDIASTIDISSLTALGFQIKLSKDLTAWAADYPIVYLESSVGNNKGYELNTEIRNLDPTLTTWQNIIVDLVLAGDDTNGTFVNTALDYLVFKFATDDIDDTYDVYIDDLRFYHRDILVDYGYNLKGAAFHNGIVKVYKTSQLFARADMMHNYRDFEEVISVDIMTRYSKDYLDDLYDFILGIIDDNRKDPSSDYDTIELMRYTPFDDVGFWRRVVDFKVIAQSKLIS